MIIGEIRRYLRDNLIRVSRSLRDTAYKALGKEQLINKNSKEPTISKLQKN